MGAHHPRHAAEETSAMRRIALVVITPVAILTVAAMVWLWPSDNPVIDDGSGATEHLGQVTDITEEPCPDEAAEPTQGQTAEPVNGCGTALVELTEGARSGDVVEVPLPTGPGAPQIEPDDDVVLIESENPTGTVFSIVDHQRGSQLWLLAAAFAIAVVAFGRWRGLAALGGLTVTFAILLVFVVPAILAGEAPLTVAIAGSSAIVLTVLYLTHGFALSTTVAVVGTLVSLCLTGLLSAVTVAGLHLTGVADDMSLYVSTTHRVDMEGLLMAGILIGSLGVLDDVTVTQAATVTELALANPAYRFRQLYAAGARVGRAHIASVINTIILAYAGTSLPLLILIVANNDSPGGVLTDQVIAQEIVRSVVATLGLIAAVPLTTALAAATARKAA